MLELFIIIFGIIDIITKYSDTQNQTAFTYISVILSSVLFLISILSIRVKNYNVNYWISLTILALVIISSFNFKRG